MYKYLEKLWNFIKRHYEFVFGFDIGLLIGILMCL